MAISQDLQNHWNNFFANSSLATEQIQALSGVSAVPRIATAAGPITASDFRVLMNATAGTPALTLPVGVNGATFALVHHPSNTVAWHLTPSGTNTVDAAVSTALAAKNNVTIQHMNGAWIAV
jgi:hypothetical protein